MRPLFLLLFIVLLGVPRPSYAQGNLRDTTIALTLVTASYAYQMPGGDMGLRFGPNSNIGLSASYKTNRNYLIGVEGGFLFGDNVREPGLLRNMITREGQIVDQDGAMADVLIYQRGYTVMAVVGKVIPVAGPNPNSGLLLKFGGGYFRHKIRIQTQKNEVPQLEGQYLEGYDRLAAGPVAMLFAGYQNLSNNRRVNFTVGFEILAGFTEPLRAMNFDTQRSDTDRRFDGLMGIRAGWSLPIYKRQDDRFHFY
ncbi:MAG: hypothetical protein WEC15_01635 [Flavobacteriales bacterium]